MAKNFFVWSRRERTSVTRSLTHPVTKSVTHPLRPRPPSLYLPRLGSMQSFHLVLHMHARIHPPMHACILHACMYPSISMYPCIHVSMHACIHPFLPPPLPPPLWVRKRKAVFRRDKGQVQDHPGWFILGRERHTALQRRPKPVRCCPAAEWQ